MNTGRKYYFLIIYETKNITRAAEQLMVSQQSLSQYLTRLESDLGVKLVDRGYSPLRITAAGRLYYDFLREEKQREEQLLAELERLKEESRPPLRIGIPLQKRYEGLSRALLKFCMERPTLDVRVWEGTSSTVRERLIKGELDIGFGHALDAQDEKCVTRVLAEERVLLICSRENPIVAGRESDPEHTVQIAPQALESQLFYQMSPEYYLCEVELRHLAAHRVKPRQRLVMSNLHAIIEAILQNPSSGFAYMPDYTLDERWPNGTCRELTFLRLGEEDLRWYYCMKKRKGRALDQNARAFWDCVIRECGA